MTRVDVELTDDLAFALPGGEVRCAVLVLSGSSGRVEVDRVRLLAEHGAAALSIRWFGGPGQSTGICEVPLETFTPALNRLARYSENLAVIGASKGAEAALLLATRDPRLRTVVAVSPTSVVWSAVGSPDEQRSSWSERGIPLPFVPYDEAGFTAVGDPPAFRPLYERSLRLAPPDAVIAVEEFGGQLLLAAGAGDQVWPSDRFARDIVARRAVRGLLTTLIASPDAGHRILFPGEPASEGGAFMVRGGTPTADRALGQRVWDELRRLLPLV